MMVKQYRVRRVYQWGSLLNEQNFADWSDIDIAVEADLTAEEFFALYGEAMKMTDFPLDLVELDKIEPLHAESIRRKGRSVYDRSTAD